MIVLAADHGGFHLKEEVKKHLEAKGIEILDVGTFTADSVDYPDMAVKGCEKILSGECERGIFFCGTGVGISIAANKVKGIRACCCSDHFSAKYTRLHNDANVLCLGGRVVGAGIACELADLFIETEFEGGRHARRVDKIMAIEK
ncbi:MAG: ribose 5-phosphate isomerase B [Ruminococcaceae bacterium]|nr:ribose 5-phosphate isomerase B [Oscillospiraceae bacterium]